MRKAMNLILLGGLSLLLAAGCDKFGGEQQYSRAEGEPVIFGVTSGAGTKTAYSGEVTGGYERIDWAEGDDFRIYSDKAVHRYHSNQKWADYVVRKADPNGRYSDATIDNKDTGEKLGNGQPMTNGLVWGPADTYHFWAVYPAPAETAASSTLEGLKLNIPVTQDKDVDKNMKFAYMTAIGLSGQGSGSADISTSSDEGSPVYLDFEPAFTAFEITLKAAADEEEPIVLKSFELQSGKEALAGDFTISYNKEGKVGTAVYTCPAATDANKKISVTFPENTTINANKEFTFTVFALPQDFTKLTLSFTVADGEGSVTRKLPLTYVKTEEVEEGETPAYTAGSYVTFEGLKKHRLIGLALSKYKWVFEAVNLDLKWDVDTEALNYDSKPIINAGALYEVSGAASGWDRLAAAFAGPNPIVEYFTVFSPKNGKWVVTNSAPTVVTLSAAGATPSEDGTELSGPINGRVDLSIARGSATGTADLNFYVEVGGRRYCINSEVTRSGAQVITNN